MMSLKFSVLWLALAACTSETPAGDCDAAAIETLPDGHHNQGLGCITGGCHDGGSLQAPQWTAAGTLYRDLEGSAPLAGGTIELVDATGAAVTLVSAQNGNFWTEQALAFPLTIKATNCAESRVMPTPAPLGSCNQGGCHETRRIHLP